MLGGRGSPAIVRPVAGNVWLGPWPTAHAISGAQIAISATRRMTMAEPMATRSWRSRCQASAHGLRPSIRDAGREFPVRG